MTVWDLGDVAVLSVNVKDSAGAAANATTVVATITLPDGTTATPSVTNPTTGTYSLSYTPTLAGTHTIRWVATGVNASAYTDTFTVRDSARLPVVGLGDAKDYLNITSTTHDEELRRFLDVVTAAGESYTGRVFGRRTVTDTTSSRSHVVPLSVCPVLSVTSVVESGVTLAAADYTLDPPTAGVLVRLSGSEARQWQPGVNNLVVTFVAGYASQPATDVAGALALLDHLWTTQRGSISTMPMSNDEWSPTRGYSIPRRVQELWDLNRMGSV